MKHDERIVTGIKALLLPHKAQEMHVRGEYNRVAEMSVSVGVCIAAVEDLSSAVAGATMFIVNHKRSNNAQKRWEAVEQLKDEVHLDRIWYTYTKHDLRALRASRSSEMQFSHMSCRW